MQDYGTLPATRNSRNSATVVITPQNSLAESAKVFLVLPLERVTGRTEAMREGHFIPAPAVHSSLNALLHFPAPPTYRYSKRRLRRRQQSAIALSAPTYCAREMTVTVLDARHL
jgi:hypothetical protein